MGNTRDQVGKAGLFVAGGIFRTAFYVCVAVLIFWIGKSAYQFGYNVFNQQAVSPGAGQEVTVVIPEGSSTYDVAKILKSKGLIDDSLVFFAQEKLSTYKGQMPKMDGWEVCREVRKNSKVPIIMLTARGDERDELLGFDLGVDEYISKPFSPKILVARVEAILRRTGQTGAEDVLSAGGIVIDKAAHLATVDDKPMDLSFKEFELLTYFLENQGIALSREKILNSVWNYDYFGDARTIDTHVKKLRSKMGDKGEYIKTVWGMGYKFEVE